MKYDVIVVGGGTSGCAAAYTAARQGLKTLLIEKNTYLGGTMTGALVTPAMKSSDNQINTEFFNNYRDELKKLGGQITYLDGNEGWFNPELGKIALDRLMIQAGVDVLFNTYITEIQSDKKQISGIKISSMANISHKILSPHTETSNCLNKNTTDILSERIETTYIVDATANQSICNALNCNFIEDNNLKQPSSLRFIASGVNLNQFKNFILELDKDRNATTAVDINGNIHLSTACTVDREWALTPIFNKAYQEGVLEKNDLAYFQVFTIPGMRDSVAFNCPRFNKTFEFNDTKALSQELINARESILRIMDFCKKYLPGFNNSFISSIAPMLGERVSRRAIGEYFYKIEDLKSGKKFENPVLISNYPIDVHSNDKNNTKLEKVMQEYQLPVEALKSKDYNNLYFVGRSISADFYAQAALRIIPSCFSMGEGLAKYLARLENKKI